VHQSEITTSLKLKKKFQQFLEHRSRRSNNLPKIKNFFNGKIFEHTQSDIVLFPSFSRLLIGLGQSVETKQKMYQEETGIFFGNFNLETSIFKKSVMFLYFWNPEKMVDIEPQLTNFFLNKT
jgi:hypothetical protein